MRRVTQLEEKVETLSDINNITGWREIRKNDYVSPPTYWGKKMLVPVYNGISVKKTVELLLDKLGYDVVIKHEGEKIELIKKSVVKRMGKIK